MGRRRRGWGDSTSASTRGHRGRGLRDLSPVKDGHVCGIRTASDVIQVFVDIPARRHEASSVVVGLPAERLGFPWTRAMRDDDGVRFLQWCLPRLRFRWRGFRKVRKQVYKRIDRRLKELRLADVSEYRAYLDDHDQEWSVLDGLCRIPISRFYRDRALFEFLEQEGLPELAREACARGEDRIRCWSAGCASGEEPYTLAILWRVRLAPRFPAVSLEILATDLDPVGLERARKGCYSPSSLKDLPKALLDRAFTRLEAGLCVKAEYRGGVELLEQDLRVTMPLGPFHLILCRNVVFTYFDDALQQEVLERIVARLGQEGALVIGRGEALPPAVAGIEPWSRKLGVYRRSGQSSGAGAAHP